MKVDINIDNIVLLTEYIENTCSEAAVPMGAIMKMNIALDEIYSNIVKFSNASYADVNCCVKDSTVYMIFEDDGIEFDPLKKSDPDISLSIEDRDVGGLGIFLVKSSMTSMEYEYKDGKNILRLSLKYQK